MLAVMGLLVFIAGSTTQEWHLTIGAGIGTLWVAAIVMAIVHSGGHYVQEHGALETRIEALEKSIEHQGT